MVSLGFLQKRRNSDALFPRVTYHDFFNILTVTFYSRSNIIFNFFHTIALVGYYFLQSPVAAVSSNFSLLGPMGVFTQWLVNLIGMVLSL